jgi:hypothetical protein
MLYREGWNLDRYYWVLRLVGSSGGIASLQGWLVGKIQVIIFG